MSINQITFDPNNLDIGCAQDILRRPGFYDEEQIVAALDFLDEKHIFEVTDYPIAGLVLPKQKALTKIAKDWIAASGLIIKSQMGHDGKTRVDRSIAFDPKTRKTYVIYSDHTKDAIKRYQDFDQGSMPVAENLEEIPENKRYVPVVSIVGYDGFTAQRMLTQKKGEQFFPTVERRAQTSYAGLVLAAKSKEALEDLLNPAKRREIRIIVAETYRPIFEKFLTDSFGENHGIQIDGRTGGVEGCTAVKRGVTIVGDLTDTGGSLKDNGLNFVIPVSRSAPMIIVDQRLDENFPREVSAAATRLSALLAKASAIAFPNQKIFEPCDVLQETALNTHRMKSGDTSVILTLDEYLSSHGKTGLFNNNKGAAEPVDVMGIRAARTKLAERGVIQRHQALPTASLR